MCHVRRTGHLRARFRSAATRSKEREPLAARCAGLPCCERSDAVTAGGEGVRGEGMRLHPLPPSSANPRMAGALTRARSGAWYGAVVVGCLAGERP